MHIQVSLPGRKSPLPDFSSPRDPDEDDDRRDEDDEEDEEEDDPDDAA